MRAVVLQELGLDATLASAVTSFRRSRQEQPVQAESATIAPLLSSSLACRDHAVLKDRDGLLHAIQEFFATPRVLQEGDIFAITLRETTAPIDLIANERSAALYSPYKTVEIPQTLIAHSDKQDAIASQQVVLPPMLDVDTSLVFFRVEKLQSGRNAGSPLACSVSSGSQLVQSSSTTAQAPDEATIKAYLSQQRFGAGSSSSAVMSSASSGVPSKAFRELYDVLYPSQICDVPVSVLLSGPRGVGKTTLVHHVAKQLGIATVEMPFTEITAQSELHLLENLRDQVAKAQALTPCVLYISRFFPVEKENEEAELRIGAVLSECIRSLSREYKHNIPLIACVEDVNEVPKFIRQCFLYEMQLEAPDQSTRLEVLQHLTQSTRLDASVDLKEIAQTTAGRTCGELSALIADAGARAVERLVANASSDSLLEHLVLDDEDLTIACSIRQEELEYAIKNQQSQSSSAKIGNASIPNVKWDDVGGLEDVKDEILDVVQLPIKHPELFASGVRQRSGILLYGPPGTGKTLLAKAIATECGLNFLSVKGPELLNMYIGESEKNVRQVFAKARSCRPCILFFDELDSLAPMRGRGSDSGGVMDRVVSQLLTEIDGLSGSSSGNDQVFVIGATNRPDLLETGLLRPGRFDRLLYLGICNEKSAQLKVVQALTRKFTLAKDVVLEDVVANCPLNFTGADFYALASSALAAALKDRVEALDRQVGTWLLDFAVVCRCSLAYPFCVRRH